MRNENYSQTGRLARRLPELRWIQFSDRLANARQRGRAGVGRHTRVTRHRATELKSATVGQGGQIVLLEFATSEGNMSFFMSAGALSEMILLLTKAEAMAKGKTAAPADTRSPVGLFPKAVQEN